MIKIKYDKALLEEICNRDNCIVDYNTIEKYNRDIKIEFICSCGKVDSKNFRCMYKHGGGNCKDCTNTVKNGNRIKTSLERYGVEHNSQLQEVKNKKKQTCLKNYDTEHPLQSQVVKDKIKQTCIETYGVEYPSQSQVIKNKIKQTCIETYGVEYALQSQEVKDKIIQTCIKTYGVENPSQSQVVKNKIKQTCIKTYGVENPMQSDEVKEKSKQTCLDKYGVEYASQSEEFKDRVKQTCLNKFGVEHSSQNAEISEKQSKNSYKLKEFTFPCGNTIMVQGYEPFLLQILVDLNHTFNDIIVKRTDVPEIWYEKNDKKHRYYCDVYIKETNTIYEVKSTWTYKKDIEDIPLKRQACIDKGYLFELFVFDSKGTKQSSTV